MKHYLLFIWLCLWKIEESSGQCPWNLNNPETTPLNTACVCSLSPKNEYSIQCSSVNFPLLMGTLHGRAKSQDFDLIYVNDSDVNVIGDRTFFGLKIRSIQLSHCGIYNITPIAFEGIENKLENLNLQNNILEKVPTEALKVLYKMKLLDLSENRISQISNGAFNGFHVNTLKLSDNPIQMESIVFSGQENSLKNLNLKGCKLTSIPDGVQKLHSLAFLDLAQNEIRTLPPGAMKNLHSLTALNLERNLLQDLHPQVFSGVSDTLSSLSLLNNLLTKFPLQAINSLPKLRVLDIGFNLLTTIPDKAFANVHSLTLLAVDGNPLPALSLSSFSHLNGTLRGLSLGGHYFKCDCHIQWILQWIKDFDLQVTSRDRDPQYCGSPSDLRHKTFYQLKKSDLQCLPEEKVIEKITSSLKPFGQKTNKDKPSVPEVKAKKPKLKITPSELIESGVGKNLNENNKVPTAKPKPTHRKPPSEAPPLVQKVSTYKPPFRVRSTTPPRIARPPAPEKDSIAIQHGGFGQRTPVPKAPPSNRERTTKTNRERPPNYDHPSKEINNNIGHRSHESRSQEVKDVKYFQPNGEVISPDRSFTRNSIDNQRTADKYFSSSKNGYFGEEVIIQDAYWDSNAINIQWDSEVTNILGFRVVYRLFGDKYFKMGQPLSPTSREFKIKNVPTNEYFVACVVSLEEVDIKLESVSFGQCREIRTGDANGKLSTHMDKIIIAASASICGTVIIAVIIFICCYRDKSSKNREKQGIPSLVNNVSTPVASLGTLSNSNKTDWDTISMYSQRSIPRARMYHHDKEDTRSHISHMSSKSRRSLADGQSQRSFSGMSGIHHPPQFISPLTLSRPDLRLSRQSLAHSQYGSGYIPYTANGMISRATSQRSERPRTRSKSRERSNSRLSYAGSSHSLTGYDTDGWTDHDMDIYMAKNATRGGLVQL